MDLKNFRYLQCGNWDVKDSRFSQGDLQVSGIVHRQPEVGNLLEFERRLFQQENITSSSQSIESRDTLPGTPALFMIKK